MEVRPYKEICKEYKDLFKNPEITALSLWDLTGDSIDTKSKEQTEEEFLQNARKNKKDWHNFVEEILDEFIPN